MNILIIDNGSTHTDKIEQLFEGHTISTVSFLDPSIHDAPPDTLAVLSGGRHTAVYGNEDLYRNEIEFVRHFGGPILGICLGFELIAMTYGAQLYKMEERREGAHSITATSTGKELLLPAQMQVYEGHRWFIKDVSSPLIALAESGDGVEMLCHESRPIFATQFHPEVGIDNDGAAVWKTLVKAAIVHAKKA